MNVGTPTCNNDVATPPSTTTDNDASTAPSVDDKKKVYFDFYIIDISTRQNSSVSV